MTVSIKVDENPTCPLCKSVMNYNAGDPAHAAGFAAAAEAVTHGRPFHDVLVEQLGAVKASNNTGRLAGYVEFVHRLLDGASFTAGAKAGPQLTEEAAAFFNGMVTLPPQARRVKLAQTPASIGTEVLALMAASAEAVKLKTRIKLVNPNAKAAPAPAEPPKPLRVVIEAMPTRAIVQEVERDGQDEIVRTRTIEADA